MYTWGEIYFSLWTFIVKRAVCMSGHNVKKGELCFQTDKMAISFEFFPILAAASSSFIPS